VRAAIERFPLAAGVCLATVGVKFTALFRAFGETFVDNGVNPATFFAKASFADFLAGLGALL
jgi:hypothetical protein